MRIRTPFRLATALLFCGIALLCTTNGWAKGLLPDVSFSSFPQDSYQLAKATFLPDVTDSELGFPDNKLPGDVNLKNCDGYSTGTCPTKAICERCPFDGSKIKIIGCASNWTLSGTSCIPNSCTAISSSYKDNIPDNNICTNFVEYTKTCYKNCRAVSCSGYKVSCTNKPEHATSVEKCPDCKNSANSKCGDNVCKVTECESSYKVNADSTGCIMKDDTCPSGYNKTCETGTQGDPEYTELGTACYQCKPKIETCAQYVSSTFPDKTVITSQQELQHALVDNKNDLIIAGNFTLNAAVDLSGKTIIGASEIASASPLCSANPKITVKSTITTNNNSELRKIHFVNDLSESKKPMIKGGGNLKNVEFSRIGNGYDRTPFVTTTGTLNIYDATINGSNTFSIEKGAVINILGNVVINEDSQYSGSPAFGMGGAYPVLNIKSGSKLQIPSTLATAFEWDEEDGGFHDNSHQGSYLTVNIDGELVVKDTSQETFSSVFNITLNINHETKIGRIMRSSGIVSSKPATVNINAATTIDANNYLAVGLDMAKEDTLNINAPLTIINPQKDTMSEFPYSPLDAHIVNINSTYDAGGGLPFAYIQTREINFGANSHVKNASRIFWKKQYSDIKLIYNAGAKMTLGGVCKKVTAYTVDDRTLASPTVDWRTPQSPFTGGC